jgi:hypothetical protein
VGNDILPITKLLNKFQVKTAFKTNNTLAKHLIYTRQETMKTTKLNIYEKCGIYKLKCDTCGGVYIGQTGRSFNIRHKEHVSDIKHNRDKSGFLRHILNEVHDYSNNISSVEVLET